jgi:hypothetical protein
MATKKSNVIFVIGAPGSGMDLFTYILLILFCLGKGTQCKRIAKARTLYICEVRIK